MLVNQGLLLGTCNQGLLLGTCVDEASQIPHAFPNLPESPIATKTSGHPAEASSPCSPRRPSSLPPLQLESSSIPNFNLYLVLYPTCSLLSPICYSEQTWPCTFRGPLPRLRLPIRRNDTHTLRGTREWVAEVVFAPPGRLVARSVNACDVSGSAAFCSSFSAN